MEQSPAFHYIDDAEDGNPDAEISGGERNRRSIERLADQRANRDRRW
jgi:hypothetical protein